MFSVIVLFVFVTPILSRPENLEFDEHHMHPVQDMRAKRMPEEGNNPENNADYWRTNAQQTLTNIAARQPITGRAKNIIMFLGDGMSIPTLAATRVYLGGEEVELAMDKFPHTALSKTYCVDAQVADSACSATAYLTGVKANTGTIGVTANVPRFDCEAQRNTSHHIHSLASWAQAQNMYTGLVTTTTVTHASPAGVYAHTSNRDWEGIQDTPAGECRDIAYQLVHNEEGTKLRVALGGGRSKFFPEGLNDGRRNDGSNLVEEWLLEQQALNRIPQYVSITDELLNLDDNIDAVLGLFDADHVQYNLQRNKDLEPSLEEMTEAAIKVLSKGPNGYFLFVEGGRIDHAHHETRARKSLDECAEFSKAIQKAVDLSSETDTLIVVTADHAHTMSISGYAARGNDILSFGGTDSDGLPYTTLNYANGPGFKRNNEDGSRHDLSTDDLNQVDFMQPTTFPLPSETHGGDDVGVFARGPWAHLFAGVIEQNVIPHIMAFAACIGDGAKACDLNQI